MTQYVIANNVSTQLATAVSSTAIALTLASATNLPTLSAGQIMPLTLNDAATGSIYEIVYVTAISGVTLTVTRAQEGTGAQSWNVGDYAYCAPTAGTVATTAGNSAQTFAVGAATTAVQAPQMGQIQSQAGTAFTTGGTAPAYTLTPSPAPAALTANARYRVQFGAAGVTGSNTLNVTLASGTSGAIPLKQYDSNGNLQPAVIPAGLLSDVEYNGTYAIVLDPVAPKMSVVGSARNLKASLATAGTSLTVTADEVIVETALGGMAYQLASINQTFNGATTGAGGMDTGALPTSGYVAIYEIYNPTTNAKALLGTNATSAVAPNVYGGANMPSGYTASALISVWPTNSSGQLKVGQQQDRAISFPLVAVLNTTSTQITIASLSVASAVPPNAKTCSGWGQISSSSTASGNVVMQLFADANLCGEQDIRIGLTSASGYNVAAPFSMLAITTSQSIYYITSGNSPTFILQISGYTF